MGSDNYFENDRIKDNRLRLLELVDYCNSAVKQSEWYQEDVEEFYALKDMVMEDLYRNPPSGGTVTLKKVPYSKGYDKCNRSSQDDDDHDKILIEMEVSFSDRIFCFHIPLEKTKEWGVNIYALEHKEWVPPCEFHRISFKGVFEEIRLLLNNAHNSGKIRT